MIRVRMQTDFEDEISPIKRTAHSEPALPEHMGVYHRRAHVRMAQQILNRSYVTAALQRMRREAVSKRVTADGLMDSRLNCRRLDRAMNGDFIHVMTSHFTA